MTLTDVAVALVATAGAFLLTAAVIGTHAHEQYRPQKEREVPLAWASFGIAMALFVASAWLAALA